MRLRWLRTALRNLDDEATYISEDDPAATLRVVQRVMQAVALLQQQPGLGRPGRVPGTRKPLVPRTRCLVPYRVRGQAIEILRVFHTARRQARALADLRPGKVRWIAHNCIHFHEMPSP